MTARLGATPHRDGGCTFLVWAPRASQVRVQLGPAGAGTRIERLQPGERGYHEARIPGVSSGARYGYLLGDDAQPVPDPASASQPDGVHGLSQVVDHRAFAWTDDDWHGLPMREYVLYELHVGTFTPDGTFDAIIPRLAQLRDDGITAIELLPVAQFPGSRNWGYDGVDLYAVQSTYGGPEGLRRLVDAAHAHGICVVLDVVYNHFGPEGSYASRFGDYFSDLHNTPWGQAVNVDGPGSDEVRRFFIDNALQWLRDFHVDALRLDAIHAIVDNSARPFLGELADAVADHAALSNRRALLIAESDLNDTRVITTREAGGLGHDAQWTDDFHHSLHALLTGERSGYYADFNGVSDLARAFHEGYVYQGQRSTHRQRRHGTPSLGLPGERFVVYAQNHDQVGNRLLGERLSVLVDLPRRQLAAAAVLLAPFVPMLFMGEEHGDTSPFPYFVSHTDEALVEAVRQGRRREFATVGLPGAVPDPLGEDTFRSAVIDWDSREEGEHGQLLAFTRELLQLRRRSPSIMRLRPYEVHVVHDAAAGWIALEREWSDERTVVVLQFGHEDLDVAGVLGLHEDAGTDGWQRVLDGDDERFGGTGWEPGRVGALGVAVFRQQDGE